MKRVFLLLLGVLGLIAGSGCEQENLADYVPVGSGAGGAILSCLTGNLPPHFVLNKKDWPTRDLLLTARYLVEEDTVGRRPGNPSFRCLCALLNRYFGHWDRMIIIEVMYPGSGDYGFVVVAESSGTLKAVTNLNDEDAPAWWGERLPPRLLRLDRSKIAPALAELDKARKVLPFRLMYFESVDLPIYILHDISSDGRSYSFGLSGYPEWREDKTVEPRPPFNYAQAAQLVSKAQPWEVALRDSPRAKELQQAGEVYAALLDMIWRSFLDKGDDWIITGEVHHP